MTTTTVQAGYKMTEIGVIPEDWEVKSLGEIALLSKEIEKDLNSKCIELEDIEGSTGKLVGIHRLKNLKSNKFRFIKGDVLFARLRPYLRKYYFADFNGACSTEIWVLKTNKTFSKWLFYILQADKFIEETNKSVGTHMPRADWSSSKEFKIPLPSTTTEQQAIATVLSDTDELIRSLSALIAKKRQIKEGAMQELLTGKKRLAGYSGEWEVKKLGEIASICRGASPRPIDSPIWFDKRSRVGWVRISDVTQSKKYLKNTVQKLSELGIKNSRFVSKDNLIMSICATVGRPILTRLDVCIHDGFVVFGDPKVDKEYLYYFLSFIEKDWSKNGQTGSQMNLNTNLINTTKINLPPTPEEQQAIAEILSDMDSEITTLEEKREKYRLVKQGIMQQLLTGKIRLI